MLNAEWNISRTGGSGNASVLLNWSSSGTALEGSAFQGYGLNIGVAQYSAGAWQGGIGSGSEAAKTATATFSSFSQFTVVGNGVILPAILVDFEAHPNNSQTAVLLSWTVSDGMDMNEFEIERSGGNNQWKTIGTLESDNRLLTQNSFSMTDSQPSTGANYYRLKLLNPDGRMDYSQIRMVTISPTIDIRMFPNPASTFVQIVVKNIPSELVFRLISPKGQILQESTTNSMNVSNYPTGIYMIQILVAKTLIKTDLLFISH
jgi:hypothetical protein